MVFNVLVIQGGSRGTNLLVPLGSKFIMMFNKFSLNVLTCQLGISVNVKMLNPRETCHALFNSGCVCSIEMSDISFKWRCLKLTLQ